MSAILQPELCDHPTTSGPIQPSCVLFIDDQICVARREDIIYRIKNRAERSDSAIHAIHALDCDEHATHAIFKCSALVPECTKRNTQRTNVIAHEGMAYARDDAGRGGTIMHRGMDSLVVEQGIA